MPGIGLTTAIVVVAETNGFVLIENERQLASYAGLDVVQRQSGLSAQATRISRRGNVHLRQALYLPAVSSLRYNPLQSATIRNKWLFTPAYGPANPAATQRQAWCDCRHAQTAAALLFALEK